VSRPGKHNADGTIVEYAIGTGVTDPIGLTVDVGGNIWFAAAAQLGRMKVTPGSDAITLDPVPAPGMGMFGATTGPNGDLWFSAETTGQVVRVTR
jgi:streptogramin lyase